MCQSRKILNESGVIVSDGVLEDVLGAIVYFAKADHTSGPTAECENRYWAGTVHYDPCHVQDLRCNVSLAIIVKTFVICSVMGLR